MSGLEDCFAQTACNDEPTAAVDSHLSFAYNNSGGSGHSQPSATSLALRVVLLNDVLLHEQIEIKRVERLAERLQSDRLLKNPPIVTQSGDKYILLDGATRVTALRQIGCRDVVVQIVDYDTPGLILETWNHMLIDLPVLEFFGSLRGMPGLRIEATTIDDAEGALARRDSVGTILLADGTVLSLYATCGNQLADQARLLNQVVAMYEGHGEMYRVAHTDVERLLTENARLSALVVFPRYRPEEILCLALNGSKLPTGITRHIIPGRAMRINIPLDLLRSDEPLEQKNSWLGDWMKMKMRERHVRFYQEPVFLFDE